MSVLDLLKKRDVKGLIDYYNDNDKVQVFSIKDLIPKVFPNVEDYRNFMHEFTLEYSVKGVKTGLKVDDLISVYVNFLDVVDTLINEWYERIFELFTLYYPEASLKVQELPNFLKIEDLDKKKIGNILNVKDEMGLGFEKKDVDLLEQSFNTLKGLVEQKKTFESRVKTLIENRALNVSKVAGSIVAARLLAAAGSLKKLMLMPSSTIQVIGAEKALFRHLKSKKKKRPPKHGLIFHSPLISDSPKKHRGKMARALASKISIAAKVDYFKGEPIWNKLLQDLEKKRSGLK